MIDYSYLKIETDQTIVFVSMYNLAAIACHSFI